MRFATKARRSLALAPLLLAVAAISLTASGALGATNLISNGTFEGSKGTGSLSGWGGSSGALSLATGNGGGYAAQLKASSGAASTYAYTTSKPVTNATAGVAYQLGGQVQSALAGQTVCLMLKELKAGTQTSVGSAQSCSVATSTWQSFATVNYAVKTSGDSLTVNVIEKPAIAGATYSFDNITLTTGTAPPPDTQAPSVPAGVGAVANSSSSVTVTWTPSTDNVGVTGYDVFRGGVKVMTVGGSTTSWTNTGLSANTQYSYTVDAFDAVPNTSAQSTPPATVTTPPAAGDTQAPSVPSGVGASANSSSSVTVSWTASTDNVGVTGYDVVRDGVKVKTVSGSTTSWTDTGLSPSTQYSYTVDAFDAVPNTSAQSTPPATVTTPPAAGDTQAPSVPAGVGAVANSSSSVTVSWTASTDNVGVTGYDVFRGGVKVKSVSGSTTSWTDTGLSANTQYSYTVDAFDAVPNTSAQSTPPATVTTQPASTSGPAEPIIVILMENKPYSEIVGSSSAPYIQSMIANGTLYTNYQAAPGSLPDYLAMTSGLTGSTSGSNNLFNQLQTAGISWGEYEESMPSTCYTGNDTGSYKKGHNPAVYYNDITSNPTACANVMPYSSFSPSHLRSFSYVVPNLTNDMHDGSGHPVQIASGDAWLAANVPAMLNAGAEVILTWDEGNSADEHVATIAIGGTAAKGATNSQLYTHPGLLAGLEDAWGFSRLNSAVGANPFPIS